VQRKLAEELTILFIRKKDWKKRLKLLTFFWNATADDLKELDEATFRSFDGVPQAEISRSEVEAGVDVFFERENRFSNQTEKQTCLQRIQFQSIKKK
jgi:tyrosyl-tRNA synthetase